LEEDGKTMFHGLTALDGSSNAEKRCGEYSSRPTPTSRIHDDAGGEIPMAPYITIAIIEKAGNAKIQLKPHNSFMELTPQHAPRWAHHPQSCGRSYLTANKNQVLEVNMD
jgi:hypothetical protein